jgi:hypothetical protein
MNTFADGMAADDRLEPKMGTLPASWDETDAWLRTADRLRLAGLVHGLCQDGMNLLLSGDRDTLVDHYARLLVRQLRAQPNVVVEVIFPTTTDMLLTRFNQWLADIPLAQAREPAQPGATLRVFVVHDAEAIAEGELQVLARLAIDFPGVCARVVLLADESSPIERRLALLGRRVLQWHIETPEAAELEHLLNQAADDQQRGAIEAWLQRLGLMAVEPSTAPEVDVWVRPAWAAPPPPEQAVVEEYAAPQDEERLDWPQFQPPPTPVVSTYRKKSPWLMVWLALGVLSVSALLVTAWYRVGSINPTPALESEPLKPILPQSTAKE